jgi:broad-specificity NMP kinase
LEKTIQIDVTAQSIQETAKKVKEAIKGEIKTEEIDWLTTISEKNDLKEFFAH